MLFHLNRESKQGKLSRLDKLAKEIRVIKNGTPEKKRVVLNDKQSIEDEVLNYFGDLFKGNRTKEGEEGKSPFQPNFTDLDYFLNGIGTLSTSDSATICKPITLEEVVWAIKRSSNNKSPGFDGLTAEFYKATSDLIAKDLVLVFNDQLKRNKLILSNTHGATRLISKVKGIPLVSELRPITLLNLDYKLLTSILAKRLTSVLGQVCKSVQSCSVPGASICTSATNIISTIEEITRNNSSAALLSLDLQKAYDNVHLGYLQKVMEAMRIPDIFIQWILTLHHNADTSFLLNFTTKSIPILFSVRQGDPCAMVFFLLYNLRLSSLFPCCQLWCCPQSSCYQEY